MKTEQIIILVVAFMLGMLLLNMVKNVCGCELKEGFDVRGPQGLSSEQAVAAEGAGIYGCLGCCYLAIWEFGTLDICKFI